MTIYGNTSRVSADLTGGGITGIVGGGERKAVIFARGDPNAGSASVNDPTQVSGPGELGSTFGSGTRITEHFRQAAENGQPYERMWGVMPEQLSVADEDITGGGDAADHTGGSKINGGDPIVEDTSLITAEDDQGNTLTVKFRYETNTDSTNSDFTGLSPGADEFFINPNTGEWVADAADNYNISYGHLDWSSAFDSATAVIEEQELGVWGVDSEAESVLSTADSTVDPLRKNEWKMVLVEGLAEPNATGSDDDAELNVSDFTLSLDSDATFLFGPARILDEVQTVMGAVLGKMAGNAIDNPILGDSLTGIEELEQTLTVPEQESLENKQVTPLANTGTPTIESNVSTSTATDWKRTLFARQVADRLILGARAIAEETRGKLNSDGTELIVEEQMADEIEDLIDLNVLRPNEPDSQRWFVEANQDPNNSRELDVSFGFTPTGVVDVVDFDATINY
jgi:hypothetical protein